MTSHENSTSLPEPETLSELINANQVSLPKERQLDLRPSELAATHDEIVPHEDTSPLDEELERLQSVGFERIGNSNLVIGGGIVIEKTSDAQRLYVPFTGITSEDAQDIQAVRLNPINPQFRPNVQIMKEPTPQLLEIMGETARLSELSPSGYPARIKNKNETMSSLTELAQVGLTDQLERSGFEQELNEDDTAVLRCKWADGELLAVTKHGRLQNIFAPMDRDERAVGILDPSQLTVIGALEAPASVSGTLPAVRVSNGWAEFTLEQEKPWHAYDLKVLRDPSPQELGVVPLEPTVEESGFIQAGVNDTEVIRQLTSINNIPITELEAHMQPGMWSQAGFLGRGEDLKEVLAHDNDTVRSFGFTHQELALPLRYIQRLYELGMVKKESFDKGAEVDVNGRLYDVRIMQSRGFQESPFEDETTGSYDMTIRNMESGSTITCAALLSDMIARYGFYEGMGSSYRTAPEDIIRTFSHLKDRIAKPGE